MKHIIFLLALLMIFILSGSNELFAIEVQGIESVPAGSLVIPMDNDLQKDNGIFNLKAYGLVVQLLENGIDLKWIILNNKPGTNSIDFSASSKRLYPSSISAQMNVFKGGPFIIDKADANAAKSIIAAFDHNVAVYELLSTVSVNVSLTLTSAPKLAILSDNNSKDQLEDVLIAARINSYKTISADRLRSTDCYSMVVVEDWDKNQSISNTLSTTIKNYVNTGGNFFALNWGIIQFEKACNFQTSGGNGFKESGNVSALAYPNTDLPYSQFHGNFPNNNSELASFSLDNANLRSTTKGIVKDQSTIKYKATTIKYSSTTKGGNVFYLAEKQFKNGQDEINTSRVFLNSILYPAERPNFCSGFIDLDVSIKRVENTDCNNNTFKNEVVIRNLGNIPAVNLLITTRKDKNLKFINSSLTEGVFNAIGLTWSFSFLMPGRSETLILNYNLTKDSVFTNTVFITKNALDEYQENDTALVKFEKVPLPVVNAGDDKTICSGSSAILGEENDPDYSYRWTSKPLGFTSSDSQPAVKPSVNTLYYLTKTNKGTNCKSFDSVFVSVSPIPTPSIAGQDVSTYLTHLFLSGNVPSRGKGEWSIIEGSGKIKEPENPGTEVTELGVGKNIFQWTIASPPCQEFKDEVVIEVLKLGIPTTITPNNDGVNDAFEIAGLEFYPENLFTIFNRWGNVVYTESHYKNDWKGTSVSGKELSDDTYFCTVEINGKVIHKKYLIIKR